MASFPRRLVNPLQQRSLFRQHHDLNITALRVNRCRPQSRRPFQSTTQQTAKHRNPDLAFVFDIDGVLLRGRTPLEGARSSLAYLKEQRIPFILLTNGGGVHEQKRAEVLTQQLGIEISTGMIVQSHTPFSSLEHFKKQPSLIVGGHKDRCAEVARQYGFEQVVTPSQIYNHYPHIWPFSRALNDYHASDSRPLQHHITPNKDFYQPEHLKISSIFVYNDPRDWGLDLAVIVDCLLSRQGYLGTASSKNGDLALPNRGYQQDGQPPLYFSNPDLWFAADWNLPRLGQGAFKAALEGVWAQITGGPSNGVELQMQVMGKPFQSTYEYAEHKLNEHRRALSCDSSSSMQLRNIYMVGDNPESDIRGAMGYKSTMGTAWSAALVRSGVYAGGEPSVRPSIVVDNVEAAVQWGVKHSGWE